MVGGSSRLVVDLVENLGSHYEQIVLTSLDPKPPAYSGIEVAEIKLSAGYESFLTHLSEVNTDFVPIHYWGECDEPWYALVFRAAESLGIPIIQNINTPVVPYTSKSIWKNVYVSGTVLREYGDEYLKTKECVVYPGSDFTLFTRPSDDKIPDNCIGMVYRLENDKLNENSISPFIRCVQLRPETRVLIVGGGSLLEPFKAAVKLAGLSAAFEFTGYVSYEALPDLYRRMSLFVAPVWKESFGQVSPFAMHMRVPVVGYAVGAIPEIVDDPGLVVPSGDSEALASLMVALLEDRPRRLNIGERHAERASKIFSVEGMINHYRSLYEEITKISK
jgi:glycosyltransferase involved in cell wall biosynthesis